MADKTIKRTAIAEFYLTNDDDDGSRRYIAAGEEVELTPRQFEKYAKAGCVYADDDRNTEVKASADKKAGAKADAQPQPLKENIEMRTEDGEAAARAADDKAKDDAAAAGTTSGKGKKAGA